jgi:serine phosphatase RsbU (regulator of sigma subunit)
VPSRASGAFGSLDSGADEGGDGHSHYPATGTQLPPGSVLALYTDGLIEHPGQDITTGMSRLARTLAACGARLLDQAWADGRAGIIAE